MDKIDIFKREMRIRKYAETTQRTYADNVKIILELFGETPDIDDFKD